MSRSPTLKHRLKLKWPRLGNDQPVPRYAKYPDGGFVVRKKIRPEIDAAIGCGVLGKQPEDTWLDEPVLMVP